jgi:hypothetical protein
MGAIYTFGEFKLNAELDVLSRAANPYRSGVGLSLCCGR